MKGLVLAKFIGSARQVLAVFVALVAIAGAAYLVSHKLSKHGDYAYGYCPPHFGTTLITVQSPCRLPTRAFWQIPLAIVIGVGGLGAAALITSRPRSPRRLTAYRPPA
jgi:hypothetical protein